MEDSRRTSKEELERASVDIKLAVTSKKVAPCPDASLTDVSAFVQRVWPLLSAKIGELSLKGIPLFHNDSFAATLLDALTAAAKLHSLDLCGTNLTSSALSRLCRSASTSLESLAVAENPLTEVSPHITRFKKLKTLNLANTNLEFLPSSITQLPRLELELFPCKRYAAVPLAVQAKGTVAVMEHLRKGGVWMPREALTVVVIGHSGSGKTTLVEAVTQMLATKLKNPKAFLGYLPPPPPQPLQQVPSGPTLQSTVGVVSSQWPLFSHNFGSMVSVAQPLPTTVLDFAGQLEYLTTHKFFLPLMDAVYLLITDVTKSYDEQASRLQHWLTLISARLSPFLRNPDLAVGFGRPLYTVLLVGTKHDLATSNEQQLTANMRSLANLVKQSVLGDALISTHFVSGVTQAGIPALLMSVIKAGQILLKQGSALPLPTQTVTNAIEELRKNGRFVVTDEAVRSEIENTEVISPYIYERTLDHLAARGIILRYPGSPSVYTDPSLISRIMALFICPPSHTLTFVTALSAPIYGGAIITLNDASTRMKSLKEFQNLDKRLCQQLLDSLQELDLCFEVSKQAAKFFGISGAYLFPSLRPRGQLRLYHSELPALPPPEARHYEGTPSSPVLPRISSAPALPQFYWARSFSFSSALVAVEVFFYMQVHLRSLMDYRYKLYADSCILQNPEDGARALLSLNEVEKVIHVIVCAPRSSQMMQLVISALESMTEASPINEKPSMSILCPCCAQGINLYNPLTAGACRFGHKFSAERLVEPVPADEHFAYLNDLWSPKDPTMYQQGTWTNKMPVRHTVLREGEIFKSREQEYLRAKDFFYRFTAKDSLSMYELDQIIVLANDELERVFAREYFAFIEKYSHSGVPDAFKLPGTDDDRAWREWVMSQFHNYCLRLSSNANINLLAGWHGTTEDVCFKIAESNFRDPNHPEAKKTDPGYFGKGIYFTQFPSYSAKYNNSSTKCLLLSWLLMGRVYPVIESPNAKQNLVGQPQVPLFDSHYAVVKKMNDIVYFPCKIGEKPEYDELVVFRRAQILPRYIFYYRVMQNNPVADGALQAVVEPVAPLTILWVDDKAQGEHVLLMKMWKKERPTLDFKALSSTEELRVWITNRTAAITAAGGARALRIITNRYRERDGAAAAAENLVNWVRKDSKFKRTKIMIFCSNSSGLEHLLDAVTFSTRDGTVCKNFVFATEP